MKAGLRFEGLTVALECFVVVVGIAGFILSPLYSQEHFVEVYLDTDWILAASLVIGIGSVFKQHRNVAVAAALSISAVLYQTMALSVAMESPSLGDFSSLFFASLQAVATALLVIVDMVMVSRWSALQTSDNSRSSSLERSLSYAVLVLGAMAYALSFMVMTPAGVPLLEDVSDLDVEVAISVAAGFGLIADRFRNYNFIFALGLASCVCAVSTVITAQPGNLSNVCVVALLLHVLQAIAATILLLRFQKNRTEARYQLSQNNRVMVTVLECAVILFGIIGFLGWAFSAQGGVTTIQGPWVIITISDADAALVASVLAGASLARGHFKNYGVIAAMAASGWAFSAYLGSDSCIMGLMQTIAAVALLLVVTPVSGRRNRHI